jgi:transporter family protein
VILLGRERNINKENKPASKSVWHSFIYAALTILMFSLTAVFRKIGVSNVPSLSVGVAIAALGALLVVLIWNIFLPKKDRICIGSYDTKFFLLSGLLSSTGHLTFFAALQMGPMSTVTPLVYSAPLFALIFSWIFFRQSERLNKILVSGAALICIGAALVTLSRQ